MFQIHSYEDAKRHLATARPATDGSRALSLRLEKDLYLLETTDRHSGRVFYSVAFRGNALLIYEADGYFEATNCGFNTPTTIRILNTYGPRGWTFFHRERKLCAIGPGHEGPVFLGKVVA